MIDITTIYGTEFSEFLGIDRQPFGVSKKSHCERVILLDAQVCEIINHIL